MRHPQNPGPLSRRTLFKAGALAAGAAALGASATPARADDKPKPAGHTPVLQINPEKCVDLTHATSHDFPVFPGDSQFTAAVTSKIVPDGYYANHWSMDEHTGTHMDAPAHFIAGGLTCDKIPLSRFFCPLVLIDIAARAQKNSDASLTPDDLLAWEKAHAKIPTGAAVFMHSGWEARLAKPATYINQDASKTMHFPGFSKEAAQFLVKDRSIHGIGVDTLSIDVGTSATFEVHKVILGAGLWAIENLANLSKLPPAGATVIVAPIKIKDASGGPTRVIACLP